MPLTKRKAKAIAKAVVENPTAKLDEIGAKLGYKESPNRRITVYQTLQNETVKQEIAKIALKKEDIQNKLSSMQDRIESAIASKEIDSEIVPLIRENREYLLAHAKVNGDLIERVQSLNVHVDRNRELNELSDRELQEEVMKRMMERPGDE